MKEISLKDLLEAGCHFGHKVEKWHPKAASFIYGAREGIHIIDLAKTRDGLKNAVEFFHNLGKEGKLVLFVATKRQSKGVVSEAAKRAVVPYLTNRWIGGFLTNWEEVKKNINKLNRMAKELAEGVWKKFPKHEQVKLEKDMHKLDTVYGGVKDLPRLPDAVFIIDIKREISCLKESMRCTIPTVAIIDTNADPNTVDYPIPANDDAVGSIQYIVDVLAEAYMEGRKISEKKGDKVEKAEKVDKVEKVEKKEKTEEKESVKDTSDGGKLTPLSGGSSDSSEVERTEKPKKKRVPKKLK